MITRSLLALRASIFYIGYITTIIPHCCVCMLIGFLLPIKLRFKFFLLWNRFIIWWVKLVCGIDFEITGVENIPKDSFILLSNHQSPWETFFLYYYFLPLTATLKQQLLYIPFFGWTLRLLKPIAIDRSKKRFARLTLITEGKKRLEEGISVLVFPEGTRVNPGQKKKYSTGGAGLAIESQKTILPVAHNAGNCWPAHKFLKYPGTIKVVIGKPIDPSGLNPRELTEKVESWIRNTL